MNGFYRFTGATFSGTVDAASLDCYRANTGGSALLKVFGVDEDNPDAPTTAAEFDADTLTTNSVDWDDAWVAEFNTSPELKTIFQELVDSFTISSSAVMVQIKNDGGTGTNFNTARSHDFDTSLATKLHIEFTAGAAVAAAVATYLLRRRWYR